MLETTDGRTQAHAMNFIDDVIAGRVTLPTVPRVIERTLRLLRSGDASLSRLADELEQDPVMSARVLRLANSSFFAGRRSHASIHDAVGLIGLRALETLLVAGGAIAAFADVPAVNLRQFWLRATVTATAARRLAGIVGADTEAAYCAGLLQGVGHLILCQCQPGIALEAFPGYRSLWGTSLADCEQSSFGVRHPQVSALWVDKLGMPADVVDAVAHSLDAASADAPRLQGVVQLACGVATGVAIGSTSRQAAAALDPALLTVLDLAAYADGEAFAIDYAELQALAAPL